MRARTVLATLAAIAATAFGGAPPAQAASAGNVHMTVNVGCYGCGPTLARIDFACYGVCVVHGVVCTGTCHYPGTATFDMPPSTCPVTGIMYGTITFPTGNDSFNMTFAVHGWTMSFASGALAAGPVAAVTSPVGLACGLPATMTFVGTLAGT